jgi:hypothetical protein
MASYKAHVVETHLFLQAVKGTSQSIELLREAVSNSVDAQCDAIDIKLIAKGGDMWDIVIQDDGHGMEERHMQAFFNLGDSQKDYVSTAIGEKGLGSKTTFVANDILVESRRLGKEADLLVGRMTNPLADLRAGRMPSADITLNPSGYTSQLTARGTRITLTDVHITRFNGKETNDAEDVANRTLHYLLSMCATGTVKLDHATKPHIRKTVSNVSVVPEVTVEVVPATGSSVTRGPIPGAYPVPVANLTPSGGPIEEGVPRDSALFCAIHKFGNSKTFTTAAGTETVFYDGTAIIAGVNVRTKMLEHELMQGWTHKSQMGVHLCKDFIPLKADSKKSRDLLDPEYFFEYKVFLNSQSFELNADRNVVTNEESDAVAWILDDFHKQVWPDLQQLANPFSDMKRAEIAAVEAARKTAEAQTLKGDYPNLPTLLFPHSGASLAYGKQPENEAGVSHIFAMMVESGKWATDIDPIVKFGQFIDASTDVLVERADGTVMLVEIEFELGNLFRHRHPLNSYDAVVVWSVGRMRNGEQRTAPWGDSGSDVLVTLNKAATGWELKWGTNSRQLLVLEEML